MPALFLKRCSNVCQEHITTADSKLNFNFKAVYVLLRSQLSLMSLIRSQMNCRGYLQLNRKLCLLVFVCVPSPAEDGRTVIAMHLR